MVGDLASLLNARSDVGDQLRLRAVAGEVSQARASIAGQGRDEAVERASGHVRELSVGQAGSNEGNQSVGELHFC